MICDVLILQKGKIGGICEFINHMRRDLPPEVYVIDEMFFLSVLENLNISLKPHTREEIFKVFPFKFVPPKILFKIFTRCVNFSKI